MFKKDTIYQQNQSRVVDFDFDKKVAQVFPDMVHRSIPGYASLLTLLKAVIKSHFNGQKSIIAYDLGCSVGGVSAALSQSLPVNSQITGVDLSADMLSQYQKAMTVYSDLFTIQTVQADIRDIKLDTCDCICINFTLQFLPKQHRQTILNACYQALNANGLLFIAEKVIENEQITSWHEQFKRNNGYSNLEIAQKRIAIENVMKVDSEEVIISRLNQAGFCSITPVFHALGFKAWVTTK